ncbi:MAG: protein kinase [Vicinamibacterales bacterium]
MRDAIGPYKLLERTGEDALGETYRARDTARGRTAFVRLIHPWIAADRAKRAALTADCHRAITVSHPSVAALFDIVDEGDDLALVHEHVEGRSLAATLGGTALNPRMAVAIGIQLADGLAELHAHEIAHGDVDAAKVIITPRGQAKLVDAGLTTWLGAERGESDIAADIVAMGRLMSSMVGTTLPRAQWADDLREAIDRTRPDHARRYEAIATLAAELRSVSAMLEARAEALPAAPAASAKSVVMWAVITVVLLLLGAWFLLL